MFWYILAVACLILMIVGIVLVKVSYKYDSFGVLLATFSGLVLICLVILIPILTIQYKKNINLFKQQKEYIETHNVSSDIENAALTSKKIELNSWLLNAQYAKKNYDILVLYPDEVLELEPIQ